MIFFPNLKTFAGKIKKKKFYLPGFCWLVKSGKRL